MGIQQSAQNIQRRIIQFAPVMGPAHEKIINNGREVDAEYWLKLSNVAPKDICKTNRYMEFTIKDSQYFGSFEIEVSNWIAKLASKTNSEIKGQGE